jgi:diguanylate cyclase (GGDEF)-like protein/PAS domain S-box-containing protein
VSSTSHGAGRDPSPDPIEESPLRLLLIEDSRADAELIAEYLSDAPHETFRLTHVERLGEGLDLLRNDGPRGPSDRPAGPGEPNGPEGRPAFDVVLLDFNLPDSTGLPTFETARDAAGGIPILVLTNLAERKTALAAVRGGAQDYLVKREVDARLLIRSIRYAVERERAERALRESEERYALVARGANDGLWDWDLDEDRIYYSPRWKSLLGYGEDEIGSAPGEWLERVHPDDRSELDSALGAHLTAHREDASEHFESEHRIRRADGEYLWVQCRGIALRRDGGRPYRMAGSINDVSARKAVEKQLVHDAMHDALTGLPNRVLFLDRLSLGLARIHRRGEGHFAVMVIDLDRFKNVNDSLGHLQGDRLLVDLSRRLTAAVRPGDTVARLGGDEFALLLEGVETPAHASHVATRVRSVLGEPVSVSRQEVVTPASIGISLSATGYRRPEEMLRDADIAMYRAKAAGRDRYEVFDREMHRRAVALLELESNLRRAVDREDFVIHYQPIVSFETGELSSFEALVRWRHPDRGLVPPARFIAVAEETGLIVPIGWWVLRRSICQVAEWNRRYASRPPLSISCNVSGRLVARDDMVDRTVDLLQEAGLDPSLLRLEITENILMDHDDRVLERLAELRALGVQLHIDDFGTGYSSLSYLQRFRYDTLKIDRSFVSAIDTGGEGSAIVRTIVTLGNQLQMNVIAEGVETAAQARWLRALHCPQGQGYWFARPMPPETAELLLENPRAWLEPAG